LLSVLIAAIAIPTLAARDANARRGFKRALFFFLVFCLLYVLALRVLFFRLS
jgi:hypothetical protein